MSVGVGIALLSALGCQEQGASESASAKAPAKSAEPAGTAATATAATAAKAPAPGSTASAAVKPGAEPPALPARVMKASKLASGGWLGEYSLQRDQGDLGQTYAAAAARCRERNLLLCTESQWVHGCEQDPKVGAVETWTASAEADQGFIVRGGSKCDARSVAPGSQTSPARAGVCCSRSLVIVSSNQHPAFLGTTSRKLLAYESAINHKNGTKLREVLGDPITLWGKSSPREAAAQRIVGQFTTHQDLWVIHDTCDVSTQKEDDTWTADCRKVTHQDGKVSYALTRYVWGGASGQIQSIGDVQVMRKPTEP